MGYRIGTDVGGTFTDFILALPDGSIELFKVPTTLDDQSRGVMNGIEALASRHGLDVRSFLAQTDLVVHGTTTADNTMIEMNGAKTGLVTTQGHRDEIDIRRGYKEDIWDPSFPPPVPIARRRHRFGIPERLDFRGNVVTPLDEDAVREAVRRLRRQGIESIAVCFLFSFLNPAHEQRVKEIVLEEFPEAFLSVRHEVLPQYREYEGFSTVCLNAYVGPKVSRYVRALTGGGKKREARG